MTIVKRTIDFSPAPRETQLFLGVFNREASAGKILFCEIQSNTIVSSTMSMNEFRRLAAKIDQHMQQLADQGVSEAHAIINRMLGV